MSVELMSSVQSLLKSRKYGGRQVEDILSILRLANPVFSLGVDSTKQKTPKNVIENQNKRSILYGMEKKERILKIIEIFTEEFENHSLPNNVSVKNYVLFLLVIFKLTRKLKAGHERSLIMASTLSRLNRMFAKYPLKYNKRATKDPLQLLFLVTHSIIESSQNLKTPYKYDHITQSQFIPLTTRYCIDFDDPLQEILKTLSTMPKFRINVNIDKNYQKIIGKIIQFCYPKMPLKTRMNTGKKLLKKITTEQNDSVVLSYYNTLKLFLENDSEFKTHLSKITKDEMGKVQYRRFVNGMLEEVSNPVLFN